MAVGDPFPWWQNQGQITISDLEFQQNQSDAALVSLIRARMNEAQAAFQAQMNQRMYADDEPSTPVPGRITRSLRERLRCWIIERLGGDPNPGDY